MEFDEDIGPEPEGPDLYTYIQGQLEDIIDEKQKLPFEKQIEFMNTKFIELFNRFKDHLANNNDAKDLIKEFCDKWFFVYDEQKNEVRPMTKEEENYHIHKDEPISENWDQRTPDEDPDFISPEEEKIINLELDNDVFMDALEEARKQEYSHLRYHWLELFDKYSKKNIFAGKALFYVLLGQLVKDCVTIYQQNRQMKPILHFFWIQNPGSGKNMAIDFVKEAINKLNISLSIENKSLNFNVISGAESDASLLDNFEELKTKKGGFNFEKVIPGILSKSDFLYFDEASVLLNPKNQWAIQTSDYLLRTTENGEIRKSLKGWEGHQTITRSSASLIATTHPVANIRSHILYNGLLQRCLFYVREIDSETRGEMIEKIISGGTLSLGEDADLSKKFDELIPQLLELRSFAKTFKPVFENNDECIRFMIDKMNELYDLIKDVWKSEHRMILEDFQARYYPMLLKISVLNAIARKSEKICLSDVQLASRFLHEQFVTMLTWVENSINPDPMSSSKDKREYNTIQTILKEQPTKISKYQFAKHICSKLKVTLQTGYNIINRHVGKGRLLFGHFKNDSNEVEKNDV